jgi:hypothetical protein
MGVRSHDPVDHSNIPRQVTVYAMRNERRNVKGASAFDELSFAAPITPLIDLGAIIAMLGCQGVSQSMFKARRDFRYPGVGGNSRY